ncbi:hypothetical protein Enr13x_08380 [Stieleria neptunia]|uniref:Uncharacterized protein n=1 Tax=Stieleria neptunia TaxID=2527979 RepID=A0A518HJQ2_9BACT|nr:hypothetical protein Enr13x_08380 [Stieleria neptunia]
MHDGSAYGNGEPLANSIVRKILGFPKTRAQKTRITSTTKWSVALGGMLGARPSSP